MPIIIAFAKGDVLPAAGFSCSIAVFLRTDIFPGSNNTNDIGMLLLGIWLIVSGVATFVPALSGLGLILAILGIAAGVFILLGR